MFFFFFAGSLSLESGQPHSPIFELNASLIFQSSLKPVKSDFKIRFTRRVDMIGTQSECLSKYSV